MGIAAVYALEVVLLTILVWLMLSSAGATSDGAGRDASILTCSSFCIFCRCERRSTLGGLQLWIDGLSDLMRCRS